MEGKDPQITRSSVDLCLLDYVSVVDGSLLCPICHSPFVDPVQIKDCDHSFCRTCLWKSFTNPPTEESACPSCRSPVQYADGIVGVPRFVNHLLDGLIVKCPHSSHGCDLDLTRGQVQDHISYYCNFTEVSCPSKECNLTVRRYQLSKTCLHVFQECWHCFEKIMERDLKTHLETACAKRLSDCPHCNSAIIHHNLSQHLLKCNEAVRACRASTLGCSYMAKAKLVKAHENSCAPALMWPSMSAMSRRLESHTEMIANAQRKCLRLEGAMSSIKSVVNSSPIARLNQTAERTSEQSSLPVSSHDAWPGNATCHAPSDSATQHLLSLYENVQGDVDRTSTAVAELDAKFSLMLLNENLRLREELAQTNAVIGSIRVQLQWLTSARLQAMQRNFIPTDSRDFLSGPGQKISESNTFDAVMQTRRSSDSSRQDTKL